MPTTPSQTMTGRRGRILRFVLALVVVPIVAFPAIVMVLGALRPAGQPPARSVTLPPWPPAFGNLAESVHVAGVGRGLVNSVLVAVIFVPASVVVASWAGLAIARMSGSRRVLWIGVSALAFLMPTTMLILGRFSLYRITGWNRTLLPLIIPALLGGSPLFVLIYVWAFLRIPRAVFDVAEIEGAGPIHLWRRVALPMVWPATIAVATLAFLLSWNDFLSPFFFLADPNDFTLPMAMRVLEGVDTTNIPLMLAGATLATIPVVLAVAALNAMLPRLTGRDS